MRTLRFSTVLALLLLLVSTFLSALAAPSSVDYDIYVNAKDNLGLNLRQGPGTEYATVLPAPIPMYTRLNITSEATDSKGLPWGYTAYTDSNGTHHGWVCLVEISLTDPRPAGVPATPPPSTPAPATPSPATPAVSAPAATLPEVTTPVSAPVSTPDSPATLTPLPDTPSASPSPAPARVNHSLSTLAMVLYIVGGMAVAGSLIGLVILLRRKRR